MSNAVRRYIETHSKSQGLGFALALILGPLGRLRVDIGSDSHRR